MRNQSNTSFIGLVNKRKEVNIDYFCNVQSPAKNISGKNGGPFFRLIVIALSK